MPETITLKGSIAGFAFDVVLSEFPAERVRLTGLAGGQAVDLVAEVRDEHISLSGHLLGKECIINGTKS